jgi:hypothetical protein
MKASPQPVTASFRQNLRGQLKWLARCPAMAVPMVYADRIHPLIANSDDPEAEAFYVNMVGVSPGGVYEAAMAWLDRTEPKTDGDRQ